MYSIYGSLELNLISAAISGALMFTPVASAVAVEAPLQENLDHAQAASIVGMLEAHLQLCTTSVPDKADPYMLNAQKRFEGKNLQLLRESEFYSASYRSSAARMKTMERHRLLESCDAVWGR